MDIRIEKLVYGGAGLARTDQGIVFVEGVLPGERAEVELLARRRDYTDARLVRVLEPSEDRRPPACPGSALVGCCDWAHIRHARQVSLKESILRESLVRLGGLTWTRPIPSIHGPEDGYRLRAVFHVIRGRPGFIRHGTHEVVPIGSCSALMPELNAFLSESEPMLASRQFAGTDTIRAIASPTNGDIAALFSRGRQRAAWPHRHVAATVSGIEYRLRPRGFFQPNRFTLTPLVERIGMLTGPAALVLDLFCGDGFLSLPLARQADRVIGVDRRSTGNASQNARRNGIGNLELVKSSALAYLKGAGVRPDAIVLDPPRGGAGRNLMGRVADLGAGRIVYVSCNPTTLAPDARVLTLRGYQMIHLELVDQFPNTHHIETIAAFEKQNPG